MLRRRVVVGVIAPLALAASALAVTSTPALAAGKPPHPKPHPAAVSTSQCTTHHGHVVQTRSKKGKATKHCQGGSLNGRTVKP